jgi:hypothetical protein
VEMIRVGNRQASLSGLMEFARDYLGPAGRWSYPAYENFQSSTAKGPLIDADLLAPLLLNVQHLGLETYYRLEKEMPYLQGLLNVLDEVGPASLEAATDEQLQLIGALFQGVDERRLSGASATTLSKILHRKRPTLIPLQDRQVRLCFQHGPGAPLPPDPHRTWVDFTAALTSCIRSDLSSQLDVWQAHAATRLRHRGMVARRKRLS